MFNVVTVFLAWSDSVDPDGDVVIYRVEVDTANTFARPAVHEVRRHCITPADGDSAHDLWVHFDALEAWTYEDPM